MRIIVLSQGLLILAGAISIACACGLILYLWFALLETNRWLSESPRLPEVPRDGSGRRLRERL